MRFRFYGVLAPLVLVLLLVGCGDDNGGQAADRSDKIVRVVTTTTPLANFAEIVGGDHVDVVGMLKANVDPHDFEPSPADINALASADIIVKNGVGLEKWFDDTIASADTNATIIDASTGVDVRQGDEEDPEGDPHIWLSPDNAKTMVHNIAVALAAADPDHKSDYENNGKSYDDEITSLDTEIKGEVAGLTNRKLVTNHDAFGYFIDHYGFEFVGSIIPSFDTQAELSPADINDIVAKIEATGVKAVFAESSLPPKTAETIGNEAHVKVVAGEDALYGDTLGPEGSDADTYLKMMRHNAKVIVDNLK